ncbi:MAG: T9SS type A sorting domain-containing protein, partial [Candidatus Cloacimonetes bacterium]|nr:T9SS type A sorting domain-containing protein [Candidatus Cloacimonadota bacterium]
FGNYPNPFNPETTISFNLARAQQVEISVYNIKGQFVKTIAKEQFGAGINKVTWNGTDSQNRQVSSGIYFYKFNTPDHIQVNKMLLVK